MSVRKAAVKAFSLLKTEESIKFLTLALTDENPDIRISSALSLGSMRSKGIYEALSLLLSDSDDSVRAAASKALGMLGETRAVKPLIEILSDRNGFVVTTAIESLGVIGGDEARSALINMLSSDDREVRRTTIKALSSFEDISGALLPFLKDTDWATRMASAQVLGKKPESFYRSFTRHINQHIFFNPKIEADP